MTGSTKISKSEWYNAGGFKNSKCWRKQHANGAWIYYITY